MEAVKIDDSQCPRLEDFFEPVEYWPAKAGYWGPRDAVKRAYVGFAKKVESRLLVDFPEPPAYKPMNHGLPRQKQVWVREKLPAEWYPENILRVANEQFDGDPDWWMYQSTPSMKAFYDKQVKLRKEGLWIWIGERLMWFPGPFWFFLQWCQIDTGYPEFIEAQLHIHYAIYYMVQDPNNMGLLYLKRRREGGSYLFIAECLEYITRTKNANWGFQGNTEDEATEDFQEKIVPMWRELPVFFKPKNSGSDDPKTELAFKADAVRGKRKSSSMGMDSGLNSFIRVAATKTRGKKKFDRLKLHRFLRDEWAKTQEDIYKAFLTIKETMMGKDSVVGRALYPSTVEDMSDANALMAKEMFDDSNPATRAKSLDGFTESGLLSLFKPAWHGLYMKGISFIGPYGESVIGKPTEEQFNYLVAKYPNRRAVYEMGGAFHFIVHERMQKKGANLISLKRQYPLTPEDAFNLDGTKSLFDAEKVSDIRNDLSNSDSGVEMWKKLTVAGRLEWVEKEAYVGASGKAKGIMKSNVVFIPDPDGPWRISASLLGADDWERNAVFRGPPRHNSQVGERYGLVRPRPGHGDSFSIGVDPVDKGREDLSGATKYGQLSKMSITVFRKHSDHVEAANKTEYRRTYCTVAHFLERWDDLSAMFEELMKCCILFGSQAHIESTRGNVLINWFRAMGMGEMVLTRPDITFTAESVKGGRMNRPMNAGTPTTDALYGIIQHVVSEYINKYASSLTDPFPVIWKDVATVEFGDMQRFDSFVSWSFALLAGYGGIVAAPQKNSDIGGDIPRQRKKTWRAGHSPTKYNI